MFCLSVMFFINVFINLFTKFVAWKFLLNMLSEIAEELNTNNIVIAMQRSKSETYSTNKRQSVNN